MKRKTVLLTKKNKKLGVPIQGLSAKYNDFLYRIIKKINHNPLIIRIEKRGELNKGMLIYNIRDLEAYGAGFFAMFNETLKCLFYADCLGAVPYIGAWGTQYYEDNGVDEVYNPWEYFFEQYQGLSKSEVDHSFMVVTEKRASKGFALVRPDLAIKSYHFNENYIREMGGIVKKYIKLNEKTKKYVLSNISHLLNGKKTLGIHIRGGSMMLAPKAHPILPTIDEYIKAIKKGMREGGFEQLFLATDDRRIEKQIKEAFSSRVVMYEDVQRVQGEYDVAFMDVGRKNHRYLCGLEVLRDAYTLSACQGFISGLSQVSLNVYILKEAKEEKWEYCKLIDKGLNSDGKGFIEIAEESKKNAGRAGKF